MIAETSALNEDRPIVVIGAGVAGLAAARRLQRVGHAVLVLERDERVGGRVFTDNQAGYAIDAGAEFIAHFYERTLALVAEAGLADDLHSIPSSSAIVRSGRGYRVWAGPQAVLSPLLAIGQKLRLGRAGADLLRHGAMLDLAAFQRAAPLDQRSAADYAIERLSPELLEYIIQPALAGIFYWTPERTSQAMLLLLLKAAASRPAGMQLATFRHGMGQIVSALALDITIKLGMAVERVTPHPEGGYWVQGRQADKRWAIRAAAVVCATTASVVPQIFPDLAGERRAFFSEIAYSSNVSLMLGLRGRLPGGAYSLLFPRCESPSLASATIQGVKNPSQLPAGHDLIALHMGGPASRALLDAPDELIAERLEGELRRLAPAYVPADAIDLRRIYRWPEALPEFNVGHFGRLQRFAQGAIEWGQVVFAGDYLGGPFVEGAIRSGEAAADRLNGRLRSADKAD